MTQNMLSKPKITQYSQIILLDSLLSTAHKSNFMILQVFIPFEIVIQYAIKTCKENGIVLHKELNVLFLLFSL